MSVNNININYTFPTPIQSETGKLITDQISSPQISQIWEAYSALFGNGTNGITGLYQTCLDVIYSQLSNILGGKNNLDQIYAGIKTAVTNRDGSKTIDSICEEGYRAYLFYVKTLVDTIRTIETFIAKGQEALDNIQNLPTVKNPDGTEKTVLTTGEAINQQAHVWITDLDVYNDMVHELFQSVLEYAQYNKDKNVWENVYPDTLKAENYSISQLADYSVYSGKNLEALRNTGIDFVDSSAAGGKATQPLSVFNSLNLLDRLRYIHYYYKLILAEGKTDYAIFPNDAETGFPCLPNPVSTKATEDTKELGAMESFYIGYLSNRDGPINAVAGFFEIKYQALQSNIELVSNKISALNVYLTFINRGMDLLNNSQTNGKKRIPDGAMIALTYLCGGNMYNLFKDANGEKHLVIESKKTLGTYMLVKADESGMKFLLGDDATADSYRGNSAVNLKPDDPYWIMNNYGDPSRFSATPTVSYYNGGQTVTVSGFKLPTKLEVTDVLPTSAKQYADFATPSEKDEDWTAVINSWSTAFSNKTQFINTSIDTFNTDVTVDRSKMDTFSSLASTFRSRAQDTYTNITSNIGR